MCLSEILAYSFLSCVSVWRWHQVMLLHKMGLKMFPLLFFQVFKRDKY